MKKGQKVRILRTNQVRDNRRSGVNQKKWQGTPLLSSEGR